MLNFECSVDSKPPYLKHPKNETFFTGLEKLLKKLVIFIGFMILIFSPLLKFAEHQRRFIIFIFWLWKQDKKWRFQLDYKFKNPQNLAQTEHFIGFIY